MAVVRFPGKRVANPSIGALRCEGCGGTTQIFAPGLPVRAWCSPWCAAEAGVMPWIACPVEERAHWPAPGQMGVASPIGGAA